jgi:hypothetical protein
MQLGSHIKAHRELFLYKYSIIRKSENHLFHFAKFGTHIKRVMPIHHQPHVPTYAVVTFVILSSVVDPDPFVRGTDPHSSVIKQK